MSRVVLQHPLERLAFYLILAGLCLFSWTAAVPWPAADPLFHLLSAAAACLAATVCLVQMASGVPFPPVSGPAPSTLNWIRVSGAMFGAGWVLLLWLQVNCLPESLLALLSPQALADRIQTAKILAAVRPDTGIMPVVSVVAYNPDAAGIHLWRMTSAGVLFAVLLVWLRSHEQIHFLAGTVVAAGAACAVRTVVSSGGAASPEGQILLSIGLALCAGLYQAGPRNRLIWPVAGVMLAGGLAVGEAVPELLRCVLVLAAARICLAGRDLTPVRFLVPWGLAAAVLFRCLLFFQAHPEARDLISTHLWWGVGPGGAGEWLARVGGGVPSGADRLTVSLFETGILGTAMAGAAVFFFFRRLAGVWLSRRDPRAAGMGMGAAAATAMLILADSSLTVPAGPAVPAAAAAVAAAGYAAIHRKGLGLMQSFRYRVRPVPGGRMVRWAIAGLCAAWLVGILVVWVPFPHAACPAEGGGGETAWQTLEDRLRRFPASGRDWLALARLCEHRDDDPLRMIQVWLPLADQCYDRAVTWLPRDIEVLFSAAVYWVRRSAMLPESEEKEFSAEELPGVPVTREEGLERFQTLFHQALRMDPGRWPAAVAAVRMYYTGDSIIIGIIPPENAAMRSDALRKSNTRPPTN